MNSSAPTPPTASPKQSSVARVDQPEISGPRTSSLLAFAGDIKLTHTIFAMPFALLSAFLAAGGLPHAGVLVLIILCMILARSFAMGMNRLVDSRLDALNPRTAGRAIPAGRLAFHAAITITLACAAIFVLATSLFYFFFDNPWPLAFSGPALFFIGVYPYFKRFTSLVHYWLGLALGLAPICAWIAVSGLPHSFVPVLLGAAVMCWTAGFDMLYATQDYASDLATGVRSMPARIGIGPALWVARLTHVAAVILFIASGIISPSLDAIWFTMIGVVCVLLIIEHRAVRADDLSKLNLAFFTLNGVIALLLGAAGIVDVLS